MNKMKLLKVIWDYMKLNQKVQKSDCILGCGCHDINVAVKSAELYLQGYADIIIFSGGTGKVTRDIWKESEADKFAKIAIELGVPKDKIYIENKSTNTGDNFRFAKKLIKEKSLNIKSIIVVHKPTMEKRCYATFNTIMPEIKAIFTSQDIGFEEYFNQYNKEGNITLDEAINVLVGDVQRMKVFVKTGWQIEVEVPEEVWCAYEELVRMGYNKYLYYTD